MDKKLFTAILLVAQFLFCLWAFSSSISTFKRISQTQQLSALHEPDYCDPQIAESVGLKSLCIWPYKFKKFMWIVFDSLPLEPATKPLLSLFQETNHSNTIRMLNFGAPFSTAIYTSWYTGTLPTNYEGSKITLPTIFDHFKKAGIQTMYDGSHLPVLEILPEDTFIKHKTAAEDHEFLFENIFGRDPNSSQEKVDAFFEEYKKNGWSGKFQTNFLDDRGHGDILHNFYVFSPDFQTLLAASRRHLALVKDWIDRNPDYLLILSSDHGLPVDDVAMHGPPDKGNEPFFVFYNPTIVPTKEQVAWIDVVDACASLVEYFDGVHIPAANLGAAFPASDDHDMNLAMFMRNALQLRNIALALGEEFDFDSVRNEIVSNMKDNNIKAVRQYLAAVKEPLLELRRFPWKKMFVLAVVLLAVTLYELFGGYSSKAEFMKDFKSAPFSMILPVAFIYLDFCTFDYMYYPTAWLTEILPFFMPILFLESVRFTSSLNLTQHAKLLGLFIVHFLLVQWRTNDLAFRRMDNLDAIFKNIHFVFPAAFLLLYTCRNRLQGGAYKAFVGVVTVLYIQQMSGGHTYLIFFCNLFVLSFLCYVLFTPNLRHLAPFVFTLLLFVLYDNRKRLYLLFDYVFCMLCLTSLFSSNVDVSIAPVAPHEHAEEDVEAKTKPLHRGPAPALVLKPMHMRILTIIFFNYIVISWERIGGMFDMNADVNAANLANGELFHISLIKWWSGFLMMFHKFGYWLVGAVYLAFSGYTGELPLHWTSVFNIWFLKAVNLNLVFECQFILARGFEWHFVLSSIVSTTFFLLAIALMLRAGVVQTLLEFALKLVNRRKDGILGQK
eukprot:GILJ01008845.1.p1 GENE.GILJ01008845.1~~GILJ01008845.1.p1  ORF type:complete len:835 (-),score=139.62 GILJ01008845.1:95-2599(-)